MGNILQSKLVAIVPVRAMPDLFSLHLSDGVENYFFYVSANHIRARGLCIGDTVEFEVGNKDNMRAVIEACTGDEVRWEREV